MTTHDDLELRRALGALPRVLEPPADDWPAIRARLTPRTAAPRWRRPAALRVAALLTLLAASAATLAVVRRDAGTWHLTTRGAGPRVFAVGDSIAADAPALLRVGTIGDVDVHRGARVRLLAARWSGHRLALERGAIHARINAPPRLFIVETPTGTAVDLGCEYTLEVDSAGNSAIRVTAGWVAFENGGHASLIPEGMRATTRAGRLGTPWREAAGDSLRAALAAFDYGAGGDAALDAILRLAVREDAVTLWHLVARTEGAARGRTLDRLSALVPLPEGLERRAVMALDERALRLYWSALPGTLPIVPAWQRALWMAWLRVFG